MNKEETVFLSVFAVVLALVALAVAMWGFR